MRIIIIAGGSFAPCVDILPDDYVICADGGYDNAKKYGIHANLVMGDMDSVKSDINELQYILCHEMVHLSQYERGDLKISSDYKTITWKGNVFDNSHDYACREWEQEAFKLQNKLWKEFKKSK